ncbi:MAG: LysR family transcriptional regulator [Burkholderiaceae bacterium]|nr:LysR family transcriptional regulator [Burkholderiaceae bacterium]
MAHDRPPPLQLLRSFALAAEHLSFKQAAAALHVTPAAVSQQIKALEQQLGLALFQRLTRSLALTEAGAELQAALAAPLAQIELALARSRQRARRQRGAAMPQPLWLDAPPSLASHWLLPRLPQFEAAHPGCRVRLSARAEMVGPDGALPWHSAAGRGCAVALRYGPAERLGADMQPLLRPDYLPVCTPALAARLRTPRDLAGQVLIVDDTLAGAGRRGAPWGWPQWQRAAHVRLPAAQATRHYSSAQLAIEAALAGQGVALVARPWVQAQLGAGSLVAPLATRLASPYLYGLALNPALAERPEVQALRDWLLQQAAAG